jgi:hypothetical protein
MEENDPVSYHREVEVSLVLARPCLRSFRKHRSHAGMRHVCFHCDPRPGNRFGHRIGQLKKDRSRSDLWWFWRECVLNRHPNRRIVSSGTPHRQQGGYAGELEKTQADVGCSPHFYASQLGRITARD